MKEKTGRQRGRPARPNPVESTEKAEEYLKETRPDEAERRTLCDVALNAKELGDLFELERITTEAKSRAVRAVKRAETTVHQALEAWGREFAAREACIPLGENAWLEKSSLAQLVNLVNGLSSVAREFEEAATLHEERGKGPSPKTRNPFTQTAEMRMADMVVRCTLNRGFRVPWARELAALAVLVRAERPKRDHDAGKKQINAWEWRLRELRRDPEFAEAMRHANSAEKASARRS